uniref:Uncharacterized protein n=1 Tax=Cacopsylla melanoneura TaxID=428564 RepID=A0A8D8UZJ6_9HEMI
MTLRWIMAVFGSFQALTGVAFIVDRSEIQTLPLTSQLLWTGPPPAIPRQVLCPPLFRKVPVFSFTAKWCTEVSQTGPMTRDTPTRFTSTTRASANIHRKTGCNEKSFQEFINNDQPVKFIPKYMRSWIHDDRKFQGLIFVL